jgi:predicted ester cyclase
LFSERSAGVAGSIIGVMSNRDIVERALVCFADPQRRERYFDVYAENVVLHGYGGVDPGLESVRRYYAGIWSVFPDACVIAEDWIEADDKVILRFTMVGTHTQTFLGVEATGRAVRLPGMTILRFENHKCVERWSVTDSLSLLAQLGAFPLAERR